MDKSTPVAHRIELNVLLFYCSPKSLNKNIPMLFRPALGRIPVKSVAFF